jgi:signal transduction histidine kinase
VPELLIGDEARLAQVIDILLNNAMKFTPENGSTSLSARLLAEINGVCKIEIRVVDNGRGFDAGQSQRPFRAFTQGDDNLTRTEGGLSARARKIVVARRLAVTFVATGSREEARHSRSL